MSLCPGRMLAVSSGCVVFTGYNSMSIIQTNWEFNSPNNRFFWIINYDGYKKKEIKKKEKKSLQLFRQKGQTRGLLGDSMAFWILTKDDLLGSGDGGVSVHTSHPAPS